MMKKLFRLVVATLILMPIAYADQTLITNVHVWDGVAEQLSEKTSVMINGNLIRKIGRVDGDVGDGVKKIDGGGRTLMPGLINSHVHLTHTMATGGITGFEMMTWEEIGAVAASSAKEYLMNGFTTVRDMGGMADGFKRAIDNGLLEGPRIYAAGAYISQTSGHADLRLRSQPNAQLTGVQYSNLERLNIIRVADGVPNILTAVRDNFANGAAYIKIHAGGGIASERDPLHTVQYTPEELSAANSAVRNWNTYWTVHAYSSDSVNQALDAGALCIDHGQMIDEKTMKRIARGGIFLTSNLAGMSEDIFKHPYFGNPANPSYSKVQYFIKNSKEFVRLVKKYKPKWSFGDDLVLSSQAFFRQHIDFEKWYAGELFGNHFALKGMTSTPGQLAALTGENNPYPGKLGVIEEGAYADLLIVDGNPLGDLGAIGAHPGWFDAPPRSQNVQAIRLIMKDGKIYKNTL
ncbi:amidohydrolase family protein [Pseudomonadales bacterium]|nr:amidohydrolase family protein [Pseudomonadales bacterium]